MSFEALAALDDVQPPSSNVYLLLFLLASYAGPDGACFVSQETLAARAKLSVRCVRDNLRVAEDAGLIRQVERRRRDGSRTSNSIRLTFYEPKVSPEAEARKPRARKADLLDVVQQPAMVAGSQPANGDTDNRQMTTTQPAMVAGPTTFEPVTTNQECSDEHSQRERAQEPDGYALAHDAYPISGLKRTRDPAAREAWRTAVANGGANGEARLLGAVKAFAADPDLQRGDFGAPGLHTWLTDARYLAWLPADAASAMASALPPLPDLPPCPSDWLGQLAAEFGTAFAGTYAPAGWCEAARQLVTRTAYARDKLRRDCAAWLAARDLTVICAADLAGAQPPSGS